MLPTVIYNTDMDNKPSLQTNLIYQQIQQALTAVKPLPNIQFAILGIIQVEIGKDRIETIPLCVSTAGELTRESFLTILHNYAEATLAKLAASKRT